MSDAILLDDLRALVECESPTEDLEACRRVINLASEISNRLLGNAGEIKDENGRPV